MKKNINSYFYITFLILYLEIICKIFISKNFTGFLYTLIFSIPIIIFIYLILNIFKEKGNKITCIIITTLLILFYSFNTIFYKLFSLVFSFNSIGLAGGAVEFKNIAFTAILKNIHIIILYFIPLILLLIFHKKINFTRTSKKIIIINLGLLIVLYILTLLSLIPSKNKVYSAYNLYYNINSEIKTVDKFGLLTYTRLDIKRIIFGFEEKIISEPKEEPEKEVSYNKIEINFDDLINEESNKTIKNLLTYFKNSEATNKNEYTGMFKDKNLIFILAEGFNSIAVDKELTPTLYKLTHEGFVFENFYSPVFLSTTGGEFQATTGLIPTQEVLASWKKETPTIKYALGVSFSKVGYKAQSYHNWTYSYYTRDKTMKTLGFNKYLGCGNGLEKRINCAWLPSDISMINKTFKDYKDYEKFITYYVSVSGHAPYEYNSTGNSIAKKNTKFVKDLPYSDNVKAYLATQIEFDRALESLIKKLEEEDLLDDTVISFVGDHYPYTLTIDEINEISTYKRDEVVEVNRSNFVIWNNKMKKGIKIDKVGSEIDVLPTLLNLFDIEYDSRLIVGKDILSEAPGLAIFSDRSWVTDLGTYTNGVFTLKKNKKIDDKEEYINEINELVSNKFTISSQIIKYDIYNYLLK